MAGHKPFSTLLEKMSPERRAEYDARTKELREEMLLAELRKYLGLTQQALAERLGITQPSLSQMESSEDIQISTLRRLVGACGGELELVVRLPHGDVRISQFANE